MSALNKLVVQDMEANGILTALLHGDYGDCSRSAEEEVESK